MSSLASWVYEERADFENTSSPGSSRMWAGTQSGASVVVAIRCLSSACAGPAAAPGLSGVTGIPLPLLLSIGVTRTSSDLLL